MNYRPNMTVESNGFWKWFWRTDKHRAIRPRVAGWLVAFAVAGVAAFNDWTFFHHSRNWTLKPFEVIESRTFCVMEYKRLGSKHWYSGESISCEDVESYKTENPGRNWRSKELMHHRIWLGEERIELPLFLPETSLSTESLGPNDESEAYVSPDFNTAEPKSDLIARPRALRDTWISIGFYGLALLAGFAGEYFQRRRNRSGP